MKLVEQDKDGAFSGVTPEFLTHFTLKENNPNFEVYNSNDSNTRLIMGKSSRIPDDEDLTQLKYGIDFHRAKPDQQEANQYRSELPGALQNRSPFVFAFAAASKEEYDKKSATWDKFYSYIWEKKPQVVWVTPHSGAANRSPDNIILYPKLETDNFVPEVAALCALKSTSVPAKRIMISVHSHNWYEAILDLGGFGVIDQKALTEVVKTIRAKYHERVQKLAEECKKDYFTKATKWLEHIKNKNKTLNPQELSNISFLDMVVVNNIIKGLSTYNIKIKEFTIEEFKEAILSLNKIEIYAAASNQIFAAEMIGKLLKLTEKIDRGLMNSALQVECMKFYAARDPKLVSDMILDVKHELFG